MLTLFDNADSGNAYKVRLLLALLDIPYRRIEIDSVHGETRTPGFLQRNPNGKVPALELEDGSYLWESNALLWYLAADTSFLPEGHRDTAEVLQWMFFEQYSHEPNVAVLRARARHGPISEELRRQIPAREKEGYRALGVMEAHLDQRSFMVAGQPTIADLSLYAYTHVAYQGGFELSDYPAIRGWLDRIAGLPGYVAMDAV
ncbi:MAG: glutathione S-transferase family protein [Minwuia sp.]|nr:glutathione S-transferase family protein [Minwuia sp.]